MSITLVDNHYPERLGIDIGRVISKDVTDDGGPSIFDEVNFLDAPVNTGAIDTIRELSENRLGSQIYLVSKCGPEIQDRTVQWLRHINFFERAGVSADKVFFCRTRAEKGPIAGRLALTRFIDDREDVLQGMPASVKQKIHFQPAASSPDQPLVIHRKLFTVVQGWKGVRQAMQEVELLPAA